MWPLRVSWFHVFARFEISNLSRQAGIIFINLRLCNLAGPWQGVLPKGAILSEQEIQRNRIEMR